MTPEVRQEAIRIYARAQEVETSAALRLADMYELYMIGNGYPVTTRDVAAALLTFRQAKDTRQAAGRVAFPEYAL